MRTKLKVSQQSLHWWKKLVFIMCLVDEGERYRSKLQPQKRLDLQPLRLID